MAAGFKKATVNASDVPATQTNFPSYVDLSRLGITTLAEAQSVRVYADSGKTTEWAREIVSATEMHVKVPSLTSTVEIFVDWDGVSADYAAGDTYGRNAVWSDYGVIGHFESTTNSTGNTAFSLTGSPSNGAAQIGNGYTLVDASGQYISIADEAANSPTGDFEISFWIDYTTAPTSGQLDGLVTKDTAGASQRSFAFDYYNNGGTLTPRLFLTKSGAATNAVEISWAGVSLGTTLTKVKVTVDISNSNATKAVLYLNGVSQGNGSVTYSNGTCDAVYDSTTAFTVGRYVYSGAPEADAQFDEVRLRNGSFSSANWETTEYNNQSDEAGFWGTWSDVGGATFIPRISFIM